MGGGNQPRCRAAKDPVSQRCAIFLLGGRFGCKMADHRGGNFEKCCSNMRHILIRNIIIHLKNMSILCVENKTCVLWEKKSDHK